MRISPDSIILWQSGFITLNATILFTWLLMLALVLISKLITRKLSTGIKISNWQCILEIIVMTIKNQLEETGLIQPEKYIGFIGTLFLFIFSANFLIIIPGYEAPTASLSTTTALAISVFVAVPLFGIKERGIMNYIKSYFKPNIIMFPFHVISEITRTLALAVRLFGNMMSGSMAVGLLLSITPLLFPTVMMLLGLLIGTVQAYIFSILATVYITSAIQANEN